MYVKIFYEYVNGRVPKNPVTYDDIKTLSFAPQTDLTLASLPICGFDVELVTTDDISVGAHVRLYDDLDTLYADYIATQTERISTDVVRIKAQSKLADLDKWTLKPVRIGALYISQILYRFSDPSWVKSGKAREIYTGGIPSRILNMRISGAFPEQTARERLLHICIRCGLTVRQWFCTEFTLEDTQPDGGFIPYEDTFWKPERVVLDAASELSVTAYYDWTQNRQEDDPDTPDDQKWQTIEDQTGSVPIKWYYHKGRGVLSFANEDNDEGAPVSIDNVMTIDLDSSTEIAQNLSWRYFYPCEYTIDVVNNGQYYPGMRVKFFTDETGEYLLEGDIEAVDFTFGTQNRARLSIKALSLAPAFAVPVTVHYVHSYTDNGVSRTMALGCNAYQFPEGETVTIKHPPVYVDVVGEVRVFQPAVASTTLTVDDEPMEITIQYS